jgi:hypothetical protein
MSAFAVLFHSLPPEAQEELLVGPALPPPYTPYDFNPDNPPNKDALAHGVLATVLVVTLIPILLAIYGKGFVLKKVHYEDGTIPSPRHS